MVRCKNGDLTLRDSCAAVTVTSHVAARIVKSVGDFDAGATPAPDHKL